MNASLCEMEPAILEALLSGQWEPSLRAHLGKCSICADVVLVTTYMQQEALSVSSESDLADPGLVWWRAQRQAQRDVAERAIQPVAIFQKSACIVSPLVALSIIAWQWTRLQKGFELLTSAPFTGLSGAGAALLIILGLSVPLILLSLAGVLYFWAKE